MANPTSQTAAGPMTVVAVEQYNAEGGRLVQDDLAYRFLPASARRFAGLARWRLVRNLLVNVTEREGAGMWASFLCRKRYVDDKIRETASAIDSLVNLGAGLDTRAYGWPN